MLQQDQVQQMSLVVYAKESQRVASFYRDTLGLTTEEAGAGYEVLRAGAVVVTVVQIPADVAAGIVIATPPAPREDTPFKPSFLVQSLSAVRQAAVRTGGSVGPEQREWRFRGQAIVDGVDPEGNIVQFCQPLAE